jgi:hypothetical protein
MYWVPTFARTDVAPFGLTWATVPDPPAWPVGAAVGTWSDVHPLYRPFPPHLFDPFAHHKFERLHCCDGDPPVVMLVSLKRNCSDMVNWLALGL